MGDRNAYGAARNALNRELAALKAEFPQLVTVRKRLLFWDLRAKTKFGTLRTAEDIEAILLHRAPALGPERANEAASRLWEAWQRFLRDEAFEDDWLSLRGPRGA